MQGEGRGGSILSGMIWWGGHGDVLGFMACMVCMGDWDGGLYVVDNECGIFYLDTLSLNGILWEILM